MNEPGKFVEIRPVRYDTALALSGVFGSLPNGARPKLDISYEFGGLTWRWRGPDRLGIPEQTLVLVLLELAQEQVDGAGHQARIAAMEDELYPGDESRRPRLVSLHVSFAELCRRLGREFSGGSASRQILRELERLCEVTVWTYTGEDMQMSSRMMAWCRSDRTGVDVLLNWRLGSGAELAERAGQTMAEVTQAIKRVTDLMGEISSASQEQSTDIEGVNRAVAQMDDVTQQNAALVEQAAAAASSMADQARQLQQAVTVFSLEATRG